MKCTFLNAAALGATLLALPALAATPDWLITSKAKLSLFTSEVRSKDLKVDTNGGVVTLFGKVASDEQKSLAQRMVSQLEGVRAVTNRLQVVPITEAKRVEASNKVLKRAVQQALQDEPSLTHAGMWVKAVDKGVVTLAGQARNFSDQLRAVALVDRISGVQRVRSEVTLPPRPAEEDRISLRGAVDDQQWSPGTPPAGSPTEPRGAAADVRITGAVKLGLYSSPRTSPGDINVDTENGVVTLFGVVPDEDAREAVGSEASRVAGVTGVQNRLEIVPSAQEEAFTTNDEDLAGEVRLALSDRPDLEGVHTAVKNGVVQLRGYVTSSWGELDAVRLTRQVKGVRGITNLLKVEPKETPPRREPGT